MFISVTMNQVTITGYLTDDIEVRHFDKTSVSRFTVAVKDLKDTVFIAVEAWNQDHLSRYLNKGSRALVSGSLKQERWESKNGDKRSRIVVTGRQVEFLDPPSGEKREDDNGGGDRDRRERSRR